MWKSLEYRNENTNESNDVFLKFNADIVSMLIIWHQKRMKIMKLTRARNKTKHHIIQQIKSTTKSRVHISFVCHIRCWYIGMSIESENTKHSARTRIMIKKISEQKKGKCRGLKWSVSEWIFFLFLTYLFRSSYWNYTFFRRWLLVLLLPTILFGARSLIFMNDTCLVYK